MPQSVDCVCARRDADAVEPTWLHEESLNYGEPS